MSDDIVTPEPCATSINIDTRYGTVTLQFERQLAYLTLSKAVARNLVKTLQEAQEMFTQQDIFHQVETSPTSTSVSVTTVDQGFQLRLDFSTEISWIRLQGETLSHFINQLNTFTKNPTSHLRVVR